MNSDLLVASLLTMTDDFDLETRGTTAYLSCDELPNTLTIPEFNNDTFLVYPNPTNNYINIESGNKKSPLRFMICQEN